MALSTNQYGYIIDPMVPFTDDKGKTIKNGFVRVFEAGSSTPVVTYRNFDGAANSDRIELDNSGRTMTSVIGSKGLTYKVCVYDQHHSQEYPILTVDKVSVIGANITAGTGATVVTGLDGLRTKPDGFVDASIIGTDGYVAIDHTIVTDDLDTDAKVTAVKDDRYIPLLNEDVNAPDSKMTLGRLWQWVLGKIKSLSTTITAFRTGDYIVVDGTSGTAKMSTDDLLRMAAGTVVVGTVYKSLQDAISDAANLLVGDIFETNGFYASGDGGSARYLVSNSGTANGMDIVQLSAGKFAILQIQDFAYPDQLGYKRNVNSEDVVPYIERIFSMGILHIKLHWGRYYMRQTLNMPIASSIEGVARAAYDYPAMSRMLYMVNTGTCAINASNYDIRLENFDLYCSPAASGKIGILTNSADNSQRGLAFRNLKINGFQTSAKLSASANWNILFDRVTFESGEYGLYLQTNKLVINLSDCFFNGITEEDVHISQYSVSLSFSHCNFGCRKKVIKNEFYNYDWRNFGEISFFACHFEVDAWDLADTKGCFIDIDDDCQVSLSFIGCDFNADKADPASTTCFKFGNRTRASYIGCHGKESQYVHFDGDFFDPDYPPEPYVGSLKLDAACIGLKEPNYDIDHSMCFVDEAAVYEGYTRKNPLNIFDNIVVNYSYAGVRNNGGTLEFFTPTPPQSCASIVVEIPPEYRNTTLTLSCWSGTHNEWYVVGTPVHPDSDRTQTPELLADTYQTGGVRDYCSINMNGNRYLLFYYYLMSGDGNPEKFAMSDGLMISVGSQYTPYAKHILVDKRGLRVSPNLIPPVKSVGINGAVPLASCNDLVPAENSIEICGEINTFGGTTDTPSGFTGFAMLHCSSHVNYTRLTQWFFGGNGSIYTRRAIRNSQSDPWTWQGWYAIQGSAL